MFMLEEMFVGPLLMEFYNLFRNIVLTYVAYGKTRVCNSMEIGIGSRTTDIFLKFLLSLTLTKCIHFEKKKKIFF